MLPLSKYLNGLRLAGSSWPFTACLISVVA